MARRKQIKNNAGPAGRGKRARKRPNASAGDRNRASPAPIIRLYKSLTDEQRAVIVSMGHGSFLDIKCAYLHNPLIYWFGQCYVPARRAFVIPCRGVIPLTEESVYIMTGLPHGTLEVKYYTDNKLEAEIAERLFPGGSSRPKVSEIGKMIEAYKGHDDKFKELWMMFIVSTVIAPTTDIRMSNKCYPMLVDIAQASEFNLCKFIANDLHENLSNGMYTKGCLLYLMLRYLDALDTNHLVLELGDARFAINAWSREAVDGVGALDVQEYDQTIFGSMELKDIYKDDFARGTGLFGGPDGFDAWVNLNTHPTCSAKRRIKAYTLMQSLASGLNGLLSTFFQGMTDSTNEEIDTDPAEDDSNGSDEDEREDEVEEQSSSESENEQERPPEPLDKEPELPTHRPGKEIDCSTGQTPIKDQGQSSGSYSVQPPHSQIFLPSDSDKEVSDDSFESAGHGLDSPMQCTQQVDDKIRGSAACLAARLSSLKQQPLPLAAAESVTRVEEHEAEDLNKATAYNENISDNQRLVQETSQSGDNAIVANKSACLDIQPDELNGDKAALNDKFEGVAQLTGEKSSSKRKRHILLSTTPPRKSPRLAKLHGESDGRNEVIDGKSASTAFAVSPTTKNTSLASSAASISRGRKTAPSSDGKTKKSAIPISPTVHESPPARNASSISGSSKTSTTSDGKSKDTAIPVSPTAENSQPEINASNNSVGSKISVSGEGKSKSSAIEISSPVANLEPKTGTLPENMCRSIVLSPAAQGTFPRASSSSNRARTFIGAQLRNLVFPTGSPVSVPPEVQKLVRSLSESMKKQGVFTISDNRQQELAASKQSKRKRKHADIEGPSTRKPRDDRPGMFTPPGFDLGISSQEGSGTESPLECIGSEEDAMPGFALNVAPLSWAQPEGPIFRNSEQASIDTELEEFRLSTEVQDYMVNKTDYLSEEGLAELTRYEQFCATFTKRKRELAAAAAPKTLIDGSAIQSVTPKAQPHKVRVKNVGRFNQSPFDVSLRVTAEQEDIYQKIMLSGSKVKQSKSKLKKYQIIKYIDSFMFTSDLADSIHGRGEMSNHCMEVGIEYLRRTNKVEGKLIMPYQISDFLMTGQFEKKVVVSYFQRRSDYSLSVMKQILFTVLEEPRRGNREGNHWYCLSMNFAAERFEALDSLRGEGNQDLISHANALISRIKAIWQIHYATSKVNIQSWELKIVNVPIQDNIFNCGYHVLYNIEKWDGQNIPYIGKEDVGKLRRIMPYKWLTADFNKEKDNWRWSLSNNAIRK